MHFTPRPLAKNLANALSVINLIEEGIANKLRNK